jgi:prepilin-type processing-associated H-X9-DG protein
MKRSRSKHWGGFTVWELLVIIAAIFVIVLLVLPPLSAAKPKAQRINCVSNLKQIGIGTRLWAEDNNGRFPNQVSISEGGLARTNRLGFNAADTFRFFQVMSNELNTPKIVYCPADGARRQDWVTTDNFQSEGPGASFTNNLVVSYFVGSGAAAVHPRMFLSGDRNTYGPTTTPDSNDGYGNSPTNGSGSRVVFGSKPAKVGWTSRIHRKSGNVAFADGSVQQLSSHMLIQAFANSGDTNTIPGANVIVFP